MDHNTDFFQSFVATNRHFGRHPPQLLMCLRIPRLTIRLPNIFFHDSTERPKDHKFKRRPHYSGKKKQHTPQNNLVINAACKVVLLTPSFEGRIHDKQIADTVGTPCRVVVFYIKIPVFKGLHALT